MITCAAHIAPARSLRTRSRRERLSGLEIALLAVGAALLVAAALAPSLADEQSFVTPTRTVLVAPEDTLWRLAQANPLPGLSTAETVRVIREINGLEDSTLAVGQVLSVPDEGPLAAARAAR